MAGHSERGDIERRAGGADAEPARFFIERARPAALGGENPAPDSAPLRLFITAAKGTATSTDGPRGPRAGGAGALDRGPLGALAFEPGRLHDPAASDRGEAVIASAPEADAGVTVGRARDEALGVACPPTELRAAKDATGVEPSAAGGGTIPRTTAAREREVARSTLALVFELEGDADVPCLRGRLEPAERAAAGLVG